MTGRRDMQPGDFATARDGRRGTVLTTCSWLWGELIAVEIGFEWYAAADIVGWTVE